MGFLKAGFRPVSAIDSDPQATDTYRANLGPHVLQMDLSADLNLPRADVIIGGPPCQGFSSAGLRRNGDRRNSLVGRFAELVAQVRPRAFVFENVEGFLTAEQGARVLDLLSPVLSVGYRVHLRKINAANYGVPQHRKRVIAVGGLGWSPTFPAPTHRAYGAPGAERVVSHLPAAPTILEGLQGLPSPSHIPPGEPDGHFFRPLEGLDFDRVSRLLQGQTMRDLPVELHHPSYNRRAYRRVMDGTPTEKRGGAPAGVRRLRGNEPSKAITGGAKSEFVHPTENRFLTIRECARLQTFPDDFVFFGSIQDQAQLIGNAVPPQLAYVIAINLFNDLEAKPQPLEEAALLSFVPTISDGVSPALDEVTRRVRTAFAKYLLVEERTLWV